MSEISTTVNSAPGTAMLRNVAAFAKVLEHLKTRSANLPGIGVGYGQSGLGKSVAAAYCANKFDGVYVECRSHFTKKSFLLAICKEMRLRPGSTVFAMVDQVGEQLALSGKPLLVDEADHIVDRNLIELVRDLYEASYAPILLIGEEQFPAKLKRWERFHNRVLDWCPAELADAADAAKLAKLYSPDVELAPELLAEVVKQSRGVHRRISVNVDKVRQHARSVGKRQIDLKGLPQGFTFYTGDAPARRVA